MMKLNFLNVNSDKFSERSCLDCENLVVQDIGYSNWTPTGEIYRCQMDVFDDHTNEYGRADPKQDLATIAQDCPYFRSGEGTRFKVEGGEY